MEEILQFFSDNNFIAILIAILSTFLNLILIKVKTRKTKAEKEYIEAQKVINDEFVPQDYLCQIGDKYYTMSECTFIKKEDVSLEQYLKSKEDKANEKKNESS